MTKDKFKELDELMQKCRKDTQCMKTQKLFIDSALKELEKQDVEKYKELTKKHYWKVLIM